MSVKHFKVVNQGPHADKQFSPDEIKVWQLPLFTYRVLEMKGK